MQFCKHSVTFSFHILISYQHPLALFAVREPQKRVKLHSLALEEQKKKSINLNVMLKKHVVIILNVVILQWWQPGKVLA